MSNQEIDQLFKQEFGIRGSVTDFQHQLYHQTIELNTPLLELIPKLPGQHSIISNIFPDTLEDLTHRGILENFVRPIYSCEVGLAKPDPDIYYHALMQFPDCKPRECLLVDDKNHNLSAAADV
ncbi:MAG: HAD-IA family hydrolase [Candidatus Peribacteria bacterium]|nr:MAG: HAD-IA family hydrolase [Candidatus Peribacteria bacterium]